MSKFNGPLLSNILCKYSRNSQKYALRKTSLESLLFEYVLDWRPSKCQVFSPSTFAWLFTILFFLFRINSSCKGLDF